MFGNDRGMLYVGKTEHLYRRIGNHTEHGFNWLHGDPLNWCLFVPCKNEGLIEKLCIVYFSPRLNKAVPSGKFCGERTDNDYLELIRTEVENHVLQHPNSDQKDIHEYPIRLSRIWGKLLSVFGREAISIPLRWRIGVYIFFNNADILYVGRTGHLYARIGNHTEDSSWFHNSEDVQCFFMPCTNHIEIERLFIQYYDPIHNKKRPGGYNYSVRSKRILRSHIIEALHRTGFDEIT